MTSYSAPRLSAPGFHYLLPLTCSLRQHHIHMNATQWESLTVFIQYLGKKGICIVEQDERGWFVQYIERDVNSLKRAEKANERAKAEKVEEEKATRRMEKQIIAASKAQGVREVEATKVRRIR